MAYVNELSGSKLRQALGAKLNESAASGPSALSKKLLQKQGWVEGQGLGKRQQGRSTHITVKQRKENTGLGHDEFKSTTGADQWWSNDMGNILAKLSGKKAPTTPVNEDDLFKATGGARFGMRAQRKQTGKWSRAEKALTAAEEQQASASIEWNGRGAAKVMLSDKKKESSKKIKKDEGKEVETSTKSSKSQKKSKKRKELDAEEKPKKKKRKKEEASDAKKEKKSKKKSKKNAD